MTRQSVVRAALALLCASLLIMPGAIAQARDQQHTDGRGQQRVRACNIRSGKIVTVARSAVAHSRVLTLDLSRCDPDSGGLRGGVLATFDVAGEHFRVWVTNPATILQLFLLQAGMSSANIPVGLIHSGPGAANHNAPWSWHLDAEQIEMAEVTIELCDARPSYVEANLAYFLESVGQYCPWSAMLVGLEDRR